MNDSTKWQCDRTLGAPPDAPVPPPRRYRTYTGDFLGWDHNGVAEDWSQLEVSRGRRSHSGIFP